jgi:mRNA interferase MazF
MVAPSVGEVILVPFPFSDLSQSKVRPAVCLADAGRGDWVLCQVNSNAYGDRRAMPLATADFATGGLRIASYARPGKLFTCNTTLLLKSVGTLTDPALDRLLDGVVQLFRSQKSA